jgi:alkylation response protein AidB-like acyl-CoA dehydrogenase
MFDRRLTEKQTQKHEEFCDFVKEHVEPFAAEWDRQRGVPREVIAKCAEAGYVGGIFPEEHGGSGWDTVTFGLLNEAFGAASSSLTAVYTVQTMVGMTLAKWGTDYHKKEYLEPMTSGKYLASFAMTEPKVGSDIQAVETTFIAPGEGESTWKLRGTKKWITMSAIANIFLIFGKDTDGKSMACIVKSDAPGIKITPLKEMMGFRGAHLSQLDFDDVEIPAEDLVGKPGIVMPYVAPYGLHFGRISTAWSSTGLLRACLETSATYAAERSQFGSPIMDHGTIRTILTDMGADLEASRQLCLSAAYAEDDRLPESIEKTLLAKYYASRAVSKAASDTIQVMGAAGCHEDNLPPRIYRNAKIMQIIEGTDQVLQKVLGKSFSKKFRKRK